MDALARLSDAVAALCEARTIDEVKHIIDIAVAAQEYARRAKLGREAEMYGAEIALRAEHRLGEILRVTERDKGLRGQLAGREPGGVPLLALPGGKRQKNTANREKGLTKEDLPFKLSARSQRLAAIPVAELERVIARARDPVDLSPRRIAAQIVRDTRATELAADLERAQADLSEKASASLEAVCDLRVCSCAELFRSGITPDAVITDPPYPKEFLPCFSELAEAARAAPLVAVMVGQTYLPEVLRRLCEHLTYRWTLAYLTPGGQAVQQWQAQVNTAWKPVLLFGEAKRWLGDVAKSATNDNDKRFHDWGQSTSGMADLTSRLTKPGDLVCDPFLGGGTMAVACLALGRRFVGCDIDATAVEKAKGRVAGCLL